MSEREQRLWAYAIGTMFLALVLLGLTLMWRYNEVQPTGHAYSCNHWIANCALTRPLSECRLDAKQLGCP